MVAHDDMVDARVRRRLMRMLAHWARELKDDPYSTSLASMYRRAGGNQPSKAEQQARTTRQKAEAAEQVRRDKELELKRAARAKQEKADFKAAKRAQKEEDTRRAASRGASRNFNLLQEKPQILNSIGMAQQYSTALVNALQLVNRDHESVRQNVKVQQYLGKVKLERKRIVRYIQLVQDEEFIGTLIAANEQIILALELYDKLSKSADEDSDEEGIMGQLRGQEAVDAQIREQDAEIEAVRQRLLRARFEPDGEIAQLQERQRRGIERHNSVNPPARRAPGSAMADLMDLNFDEADAPASRPLEPRRHASPDSDGYSDESDDAQVAMASASGNANRFDPRDDEDDDTGSIYYTRRPQIGPRYASSFLSDEEDEHLPARGHASTGQPEDDDDFDPFADPEGAVPQSRPARQSYAVA